MPSVVPLRAAFAWINFSCASANAFLASLNDFISGGVSFSVRSAGVFVPGTVAVASPVCGCNRASIRMALIIVAPASILAGVG
jgi:hypothetical protein